MITRDPRLRGAAWISTAELCRLYSMSRMQLDRLRRGLDPKFHPGIHFISKGQATNAALLWNPTAVEQTMAAMAAIQQNHEMPFKTAMERSFTEGLTEEQTAAFVAITNLIASAKDTESANEPGVLSALLTGYAGTGKSFLVARLQKWCEWYFVNHREAVAVLTPTHKAASELTQKLRDAKSVFTTVETLTRFLGKKKGWDDDGNKKFTVKQKDLPFTSPTLRVVFLDELSMVSDRDLLLLVQRLEKKKRDVNYPRRFPQIVLIGIGDPAQLEPVKETNTMFTAGEEDSEWEDGVWDIKAELKTVVRHTGPILDLATEVRQHGLGRPVIETNDTPDEPTRVKVLSSLDWMDEWLQLLHLQQECPDEHDVQCLAYTNRAVQKLNTIAREELYGNNAAPFQSGERIVTADAVIDPDDGTVLCGSATEICIVESELQRTELEGTILKGFRINGFMPYVKDDYGNAKSISFLTVDPADRDEYKKAVQKAKDAALALQKRKNTAEKNRQPWPDPLEEDRKALWRNYYMVAEFFSPVEPAYCLTVHKSQGSTYSTVFVDQIDLDSCKNKKDLNRLTYVAVSRASSELVIRL